MRYETYETQKLNVMRHCCVIVLVNVFAPAPFVASSLRSVVLTFVAHSLHKADSRRCLMAFFVISSLPVRPSVHALPRRARIPFRCFYTRHRASRMARSNRRRIQRNLLKKKKKRIMSLMLLVLNLEGGKRNKKKIAHARTVCCLSLLRLCEIRDFTGTSMRSLIVNVFLRFSLSSFSCALKANGYKMLDRRNILVVERVIIEEPLCKTLSFKSQRKLHLKLRLYFFYGKTDFLKTLTL